MSSCLQVATAAAAAASAAGKAASSRISSRSRCLFRLTAGGISNCRQLSSGATHPLSRRQSDTADVVVIGGGIVGVSAAYHLAKAGVKEVVLLEKSELTAGSTWHAAGLTTYFHPGINVRKLHYYSLKLYEQLQQETGQDVGLHKPGSLRLITTPLRMDEAKYQMSRSHWCQAEQRLLGPEACLELCPLLQPDTVLGGLYNPGDGHVDPYSVTMAMAAAARRHGAEIFQNCRVRSTHQEPDGTWTVGTDHGHIRATHVINAAGFHARDVGKLAGLDLPIIPVHHQFVITSPLPAVQRLQHEIPVLRDLEGSYYLRQEKQGLLVGPYESADSMVLCKDWYDNGVPDTFGRELFEPDLERIMPQLQRAMEMVPALQEAEIQSVIAGPITYNAENAGLVGPVAGLHNYWLLAGFGYGIVHGGGVGKFVSDWIVDSEPPFELRELDANRYGWWADRRFLFARAAETYGANTSVGCPKEERPAGRPTARAGALHSTLAEEGAQFGFSNGWELPQWFAERPEERGQSASFRRPNWFAAVGRECDAVLRRVGVVDLSPFSKFRIGGRRAAEFLDGVSANRLPAEGGTRIAHLLTPGGRVFAELTLTRTAELGFLALGGAGAELRDFCWLLTAARRRGFGADSVSVENWTDAFAGVGVAGPLARDLLQPLTDADLSPEAFRFMSARPATVAGVRCLAARLSYTGELGWELYCRPGEAQRLYAAVRARARLLGGRGFGAFALNSLRMEKGFRLWGADVSCDTDPLEAGLASFVRLDKEAGFVGKEAVARAKAAGCRRHLRLLRVDCDDVDPEGNETVWIGDEVAGHTTSGAHSYSLDCGLAFAYLPQSVQPGAEVQVELLGCRRPATVLPRPPMLPEPQRRKLQQPQSQ